jgi:hypothetical protein
MALVVLEAHRPDGAGGADVPVHSPLPHQLPGGHADQFGPLLSANLLNEVLYMLGTVSYGLAAMLAPVALVLLTETFQSIFVLVMAILIARFIPQFATESVDRTHVALKGVAICITGLGTYLLLVAR